MVVLEIELERIIENGWNAEDKGEQLRGRKTCHQETVGRSQMG
jgi:hypothetical protein